MARGGSGGSPPEDNTVSRRLVVEADGGSRGNPGPAGYGALVRDPATGQVLAEAWESLGTTTNNVAEYSGLVAGLRAAAELAPGADVEVRMDSKLVVEQMSGRWKIKDPNLRSLARLGPGRGAAARPGDLYLGAASPQRGRRPAREPGHGLGQGRSGGRGRVGGTEA